ncbi:MAG TPA: sigma-70 family RNA polymerase sigma factor [Candidatus Sulfotelmatobacter sp.]|nr:sigma-70 family RNA polymerase sigma factor [Candidatus Sulfotelmatobacter sp.]
MHTTNDMALLREYAANHSDHAFAELVARRIHFVHSAALRQVRDPNLAEEITQAVFVILAQKAGKISEKTLLSGWLFKTTRFAALAQMRAEAKRRQHELEAHMQPEFQSSAVDEIWAQMSPHLDKALGALAEKDRQAVLLRFFENKSLAEVGTALNMAEDTARKRVSRALDKLRKFFARQGIASTSAIIAAVISANSVHAAPAGLAATVAASAMKGPAAAVSTLSLVKGTFKLMTYAKLKLSLGLAAAVLLTAGTVNVAISSMVRPDANPGGEASPQETGFANEIIKATADGNYQGFVADGDKDFKSISEQQFKDVCEQAACHLKSGYHMIFLGSFHLSSVPDHVTLWKISFNDGSDDAVLHLSVNHGKITGALLLSPLE